MAFVGITAPANDWDSVTLDEVIAASANGHKCRALFIGAGGNVNVQSFWGNSEIFYNVPDGTTLPVEAKKVHSTDTSATNIIALY